VVVNNRLISNAPEFKKAVKMAYDQIFKAQQKNIHPLVYLSISVDPKNVDVNVDPAKAKVRILKDVEAASKLRERIVEMLTTWDNTRKQVEKQLQQSLIEPKSKKSKLSPTRSSKTKESPPPVVSKRFVDEGEKAKQFVPFSHENSTVQGLISDYCKGKTDR
jgi:DNA mismatch repair protein MLH1